MFCLAVNNAIGLQISGMATTVDNYQGVSSPDLSSWVEGTNFASFSVTLTSDNPVLTIFTVGNDDRSFLTPVQVAAVPEPATYAAILGLLALGRLRKSST